MTIAVLIVVSSALASAMLDAKLDFNRIRNGEHIDHAGGLIERVVLGLLIVATVWSVLWHTGHHWSIIFPMMGLWWATFTIVFRLRLNTLRGLDPTYVSLSNTYDRVFILLFSHRAGAAAYTFEGTVLAICSLWAFRI